MKSSDKIKINIRNTNIIYAKSTQRVNDKDIIIDFDHIQNIN